MKFLPDPRDYPENRLFCLDVLRGLDMFYLACGSTVCAALFTALKMPATCDFLASHPWEGFTLYDLIMPLFIFMTGAAVPLALTRRLTPDGRLTAAFHRHVWSRFAMLWVLGMLAQGGLATLDWHRISPYSNTLQTIAVGYVVAAYLLTVKSWAVRLAVPVALTLAYGLIVHFGGDYTKDGNVTMAVELPILRAILPADNEQIGYVIKYGYTWFLPSLMFPVIALAGAFSTLILSAKDRGAWARAGSLAAFGVGALVCGLALEALGVRCVKHIFSVSFTLQAIGWSVLALAVLFVLCDIGRFRRGTGLLLLYGQFALCAYCCESIFRDACFAAGNRLFGGVARFFDPVFSETVSAVAFSVVVTAIVIVWRGYKLARKHA